MCKPMFAACIVAAVLFSRPDVAVAQLASKAKPAQDLLVDYLLHADEVSSSHCCQLEGTVSVVDRSGKRPPYVKSVFGISAVKGIKTSYHCWGEQSLRTDVTRMKPVGWREQLWDGEKRHRKMSGGRTGATAREIEEPKKKGDKNPDISSMTILDPMGIVLGASSEMHGDRSNLGKKKQFFLSCKIWKSSKLENGDVVGYWIAPNEFSVASIQFGHKVNFMPVRIDFHLWNEEEAKPGEKFSEVKTQWRAYGEGLYYLPAVISIVGKQGKDQVVETKLDRIVWAAPEKWAQTELDFRAIAIAPNSIWRDRFLPFLGAENARTQADVW